MATRAVVYARVSTDRQESDGTSLTTQEARCREFAAAKGWTVVAVFSGAEGAAYRDRPNLNLNRVRDLIREGGCDILLCHDLDRLTRDQRDAFILYEEAEDAGVRWEFVRGEPFADTALGRFILSARSFAAEVEREQKSERTVRGIEAHARAGRRMPSTHPVFGYVRDGNRLLENPDTAPVVRRIFREALAGRPVCAIAVGLNVDGVPSPRGARWPYSTVRLILRNSDYTGAGYALKVSQRATRVAGKKKLVKTTRPLSERVLLPEGTIEPLIDRATFVAVQVRLERNKAEATRSAKYPKEDALL